MLREGPALHGALKISVALKSAVVHARLAIDGLGIRDADALFAGPVFGVELAHEPNPPNASLAALDGDLVVQGEGSPGVAGKGRGRHVLNLRWVWRLVALGGRGGGVHILRGGVHTGVQFLGGLQDLVVVGELTFDDLAATPELRDFAVHHGPTVPRHLPIQHPALRVLLVRVELDTGPADDYDANNHDRREDNHDDDHGLVRTGLVRTALVVVATPRWF